MKWNTNMSDGCLKKTVDNSLCKELFLVLSLPLLNWGLKRRMNGTFII